MIISGKLERDCRNAERVLREFISELTAKHLREMRGRLPDGVLSVAVEVYCETPNYASVDGTSFTVADKCRQEALLVCTAFEHSRRLRYYGLPILLEDCGVPGMWMEVSSAPYLRLSGMGSIVESILERVY